MAITEETQIVNEKIFKYISIIMDVLYLEKYTIKSIFKVYITANTKSLDIHHTYLYPC